MKKGFSLIELLVVMAIFVTISSVVLFSQNKFSSSTNITNQAYEIALVARNAQSYGISVRARNPTDTDKAYGLHFSNLTIANQPSSFILFYDGSGNNMYDSPSDSVISTYSIPNGNKILSVCLLNSTTNSWCLNQVNTNEYVDINFLRPNPNAIIKYNISSVPSDINRVQITLQSALKDRTKVVEITNTGQISVK